MRLTVLASPKPGYIMPLEEALVLTGQEGNICYMKEDIATILAEPVANSLRRAKNNIADGHHSVADHVHYCLAFEGIPKIEAMILNNGKDYDSSEKSGRFTEMKASKEEEAIYHEWIDILIREILKVYPQLDETTARKRAQENARYMMSVFTPATTLGHTLSLRQINYLIGYCDKFIEMPTADPFLNKLKPFLSDLRESLSIFDIPELRDNKAYIWALLNDFPEDETAEGGEPSLLGPGKGYGFSLFARRKRDENIGESFCINSTGSFAMLAQLQRHRFMMHDEMLLPDLDNFRFFTPPIIADPGLLRKWEEDITSVKGNYPQGMLLDICSVGFVDSFVRLSQERLCGAAQYEICMWAKEVLRRLISGCVEGNFTAAAKELIPLDSLSTKCRFGNYVCHRPCPLGPNEAFTRLI